MQTKYGEEFAVHGKKTNQGKRRWNHTSNILHEHFAWSSCYLAFCHLCKLQGVVQLRRGSVASDAGLKSACSACSVLLPICITHTCLLTTYWHPACPLQLQAHMFSHTSSLHDHACWAYPSSCWARWVRWAHADGPYSGVCQACWAHSGLCWACWATSRAIISMPGQNQDDARHSNAVASDIKSVTGVDSVLRLEAC